MIEAAARTGTMLEINSAPDRRDLNDVHARAAAQAGVRILSTPTRTGQHARRHALGHRHGAPRLADGATSPTPCPWSSSRRCASGARAARSLSREQARAAARSRHDGVDARRGGRARAAVRRALGVVGRRVVERGAQRGGEVVADEARVERAGERQRGVGAGRRRGHEHAAVGERLELGDAVVLAARGRHVDAGAAQQRAVRRPGASGRR